MDSQNPEPASRAKLNAAQPGPHLPVHHSREEEIIPRDTQGVPSTGGAGGLIPSPAAHTDPLHAKDTSEPMTAQWLTLQN